MELISRFELIGADYTRVFEALGAEGASVNKLHKRKTKPTYHLQSIFLIYLNE